ncbi:isoprenoid biosynthesis glyoxalase ElbB [Fidelibacter multiformis]|uniref:isoprenoid biosynthesis glyoxalase ElbB n=1 Tax=Fidelibacter multiformis TaxID=3377529 RepID=UPI0037DCFF08
MATVGVILSGCGIFDGSEIHESVLTLLALDKAGASVHIFAPSGPQKHVVDHVRNKVVKGEERDILEESARIARGKIQDISRADLNSLDALIFPGGSGIVKNLSNFSDQGPQCTLVPKVERLIIDALEQKKVLGFMCLAPLLAAKAGVRAGRKPLVTLGNDPDMARAVEAMGAEHKNCPAVDVVIDTQNQIVTTPAYMLARSISEAETGITKLVRTVLSMI